MSVRALRRGTMAGRGVSAAVAPVYRASSGLTNGGFVASFTITIPAVVQVGDLMLIGHIATATTAVLTVPAGGWAQLNAASQSGAGSYCTFYKFAEGSDTGGATTVTLTSDGGTTLRMVAAFAAYSGAAASPFDTVGTITTNSGSSVTSPAIVTTVPNTAVVRISTMTHASSSPTMTATPVTERVKGTGGSRVAIGVSDAAQVAAGNTGTGTFTCGSGGTWLHNEIALKGA